MKKRCDYSGVIERLLLEDSNGVIKYNAASKNLEYHRPMQGHAMASDPYLVDRRSIKGIQFLPLEEL